MRALKKVLQLAMPAVALSVARLGRLRPSLSANLPRAAASFTAPGRNLGSASTTAAGRIENPCRMALALAPETHYPLT